MKILVVGGGGREHALVWKLAQSPRVDHIWIAPGNPGTAKLGTNLPVQADDIDGLVRIAQEHAIDLTVVGPEIPLALGLTDALKAKGLRCWGPSKAAAQLEGSKVVMKEFLRRHNIPTASFRLFNKAVDAHAYIDEVDGPLVVKCDGLAAGKGVTVAKNAEEAHQAVTRIMERHEFGRQAGAQIVIEEVLKGEEISVFAFCDGHNAVLLEYAQDHKQVFDGDEGPMTGGMGAFSPAQVMKPRDEDEMVRRILVPTMSGLVHEERPYVGVLFMGLMITDSGPKVLEYNVRFGDPECQTLMMRLESDLVNVLEACIDGTLDQIELTWNQATAVCVNLASGGYPDKYPNDLPITGLDAPEVAGNATVFHAGTRDKAGQLVTAGGRVLSVCALGANIDEARAKAYAACDAIAFDGKHCRRDIGKRREARRAR
ncbi:MAG: phosphoribosylamine--glycine ligase [Planctomycetes bacterium]|nr:phosphoribosylamine--glycine ligase [Planctomycetota bacterium]